MSDFELGQDWAGLVKTGISGGWTWFGGPKCVTFQHGFLLAHVSPSIGESRGESCVTYLSKDITTELGRYVVLYSETLDDHNVPSILRLSSRLALVAATEHDRSSVLRIALLFLGKSSLRVITKRTFRFPDPTTYSYLFRLRRKILIATRSQFRNLTGMWMNWILPTTRPVFRLLPWAVSRADPRWSGRDGGRPYSVFSEAPGGGYVFAATNDHPRAYRNGLYLGRLAHDAIRTVDGMVVSKLGENRFASLFSLLQALEEPGQTKVPWVHDVHESESGEITVAYSLTPKPDKVFFAGFDSRVENITYRVAVVSDGRVSTSWDIPAGTSFYPSETDYTGGIALNPRNPRHVIFSSLHDFPGPGISATRRWRLWECHLEDSPVSQNYRLLASSKEADVLRPVFSRGNGQTHAVFFQVGRYSSYNDFDTVVYGLRYEKGLSCFETPEGHIDLPYSIEGGTLPGGLADSLAKSVTARSTVLELGGGGTTVSLFASGCRKLICIDADKALLWVLQSLWERRRDLTSSREFRVVHWPLKAYGPWSYPVGSQEDALDLLLEAIAQGMEHMPDVCLIDSRYRVRCFMEIVSLTTAPVTIIWDDYQNRPQYRVIEEDFVPARTVGRVAEFYIESSRPFSKIKESRAGEDIT